VVLLDAGMFLVAEAPPVDALLAACRGARVVFCSGYDRDFLEERGLVPADAVFLAKPGVLSTLCGTLRQLLDSFSGAP
jgi:hypothetical protein